MKRSVALIVICVAAARPACAVTPWHPLADPYRGTLDHAVDALVQDGADPDALNLLRGRWLHGGCMIRRLRDGEIFDLMVYGAGRVERDVIVLLSLVRARGVSEDVVECRHVGPFGIQEFLRPLACGNWSYREFPLPPAPFPPAGWGGGIPIPPWFAGGPPGEAEFGEFPGLGFPGLPEFPEFVEAGRVETATRVPAVAAGQPMSGATTPSLLNGGEEQPAPTSPVGASPGASVERGGAAQVPEPSSALLLLAGAEMLLIIVARRGVSK